MSTGETTEVIFVGLPGPTHNYGGLSGDNVASGKNRGQISSPQLAAKQAVGLVRQLIALDIPAGILPPQLRPHVPLLNEHFMGTREEVIAQAAAEDVALLEKASSSSAMWVANAATVTPGVDAADGKLHLTTANLFTNLHRRIETRDTHHVLSQIFEHAPDCVVHEPLPDSMPDEGAANHTRLAPQHSDKGLHVFVYGKDGSAGDAKTARQSLAASQAIAKAHALPDDQVVFIKQNPEVINDGVFHNDVIAVGNQNLYFVHERAYANGGDDIAKIEAAYAALHPGKILHMLVVPESRLTVKEAVHTYLFNSQIISKPDGGMAVIAPTEVQELFDGKAAKILQDIVADNSNPINEVRTADLRQSMRNGGGPACLRLRVPMTDGQLAAIREYCGVITGDAMLKKLERLIEAHYPMQLPPQDIKDPALYDACHSFLEALSKLMKIRLV
ncbi:MAG: N-succinylarginine dihydrolase [Alphaproteobacteria bacterium]